MNIRRLAERHLAVTLEADGWPVSVFDPSGNFASLMGQSGDISQVVDPDTGQVISSRQAHVALRISSLTTKGLELPKGISDGFGKPWLLRFDDIGGTPWTFKVVKSNPDRTVGVVTCLLELYHDR